MTVLWARSAGGAGDMGTGVLREAATAVRSAPSPGAEVVELSPRGGYPARLLFPTALHCFQQVCSLSSSGTKQSPEVKKDNSWPGRKLWVLRDIYMLFDIIYKFYYTTS